MEKIELEGIGHIKYAIMEGDEQVSPFIELMSIFIKPKFRRQKYGSALIAKLLKVAIKNGITCIYVKATATNFEFRNFLKKNGFTISSKLLYQKRAGLLTRLKKRIQRREIKLLTT